MIYILVMKANNSYPKLSELKNKSREEVAMLLNACDVALMTSHTEGSPQFIKEAMALGPPQFAAMGPQR